MNGTARFSTTPNASGCRKGMVLTCCFPFGFFIACVRGPSSIPVTFSLDSGDVCTEASDVKGFVAEEEDDMESVDEWDEWLIK